jgi:hypothetical protein
VIRNEINKANEEARVKAIMRLRGLFLAILFALAIASVGCAECKNFGKGFAVCMKGEYITLKPAPIDRVWIATKAATEELGLSVTFVANTPYRLNAISPEGETLAVRLESFSTNATRVCIRIELGKDNTLADRLLKAIDGRL